MFDPQVNDVNKMAVLNGPPGHNGSQGPADPPGPKGAGDFSSCQYKIVKDYSNGGTNNAIVGQTEPNVSFVLTTLFNVK